jgi:hypothetical protein
MAALGIQSNAPMDRAKRMLMSRRAVPAAAPSEAVAPEANAEPTPLVVDQ